MDEPVARVSPRRLLIAAAVTVAVLPLLVLGNVWAGSDGPGEVAATSDTIGPAPPKGVSAAPTLPVDPLSADEVPAGGTSSSLGAATPTTRAIPSTTTSTQPGPSSASAEAEKPPPPPEDRANVEEGQVTWSDFEPGTCHHRTIAFDTVVRVTNVADGSSTTCVVAGRGPYVRGRIMELERSVFAQLGPTDAGVLTVRIEW